MAGGLFSGASWRRAAAGGVRGALGVAVVYLAMSSAYGFVRLVRGHRPTAKQAAPAVEVDAAALTAGRWTLDGFPPSLAAALAAGGPAPPEARDAGGGIDRLRRLFAATPAQAELPAERESLLPASGVAKRVAVRHNDSGRLDAEVWHASDLAAAVRAWDNGGRRWAPSPVTGADAGWRVDGPRGRFHALAWRLPDGGEAILLVVAASHPKDPHEPTP